MLRQRDPDNLLAEDAREDGQGIGEMRCLAPKHM